MRMPNVSGLECLQQLKSLQNECEVIMLTGEGSIETAVQAMKSGAFDFITKPFRKEQILLSIDKAMRWREMVKQNKELRKKLESGAA